MTENADDEKEKMEGQKDLTPHAPICEQEKQPPHTIPPDDTDQTSPISEVEEGKESKQPLSEVEQLKAELAKKEEDYKALYAQLQRALADFDNYRKRALRDQDEARRSAGELVIISLLEPVENLPRALEASAGSRSVKELRKGLQMIEKQAWCALEAGGLRRIDALGKPFDHALHEAVEQAEGDEDGKVI